MFQAKLDFVMSWVKSRIAERTSWDGAMIIGMSVLVLVAAPIIKLLAWPALAYGIFTLLKEEKIIE
tara:strand:+ start:415 stop:612 length:198 start_codon:yes stop_codon:yes gene_type:complete